MYHRGKLPKLYQAFKNPPIEYREVCKTVSKRLREEVRQYKIEDIRERIQTNKSIKKGKRHLEEGTKQISCVLDKNGESVTNQDNILTRIEEFYTELYASTDPIQDRDQNRITQNVNEPKVTTSEVRHALSQNVQGQSRSTRRHLLRSNNSGGQHNK